MRITLSGVGKRYNRDWIFRNLDYEFTSGNGYAILGGNGSGKSTFLQIISGFESVSEGAIEYVNNESIDRDRIFEKVAVAAPYVELLEEFTLEETFSFHNKLKPTRVESAGQFAEKIELPNSVTKELRDFSSGMKQRVKLGLAILSKCPILLLDEPISNLDTSATNWYNNLLGEFAKDKLVLICSNQGHEEHGFCTQQLNVEEFK